MASPEKAQEFEKIISTSTPASEVGKIIKDLVGEVDVSGIPFENSIGSYQEFFILFLKKKYGHNLSMEGVIPENNVDAMVDLLSFAQTGTYLKYNDTGYLADKVYFFARKHPQRGEFRQKLSTACGFDQEQALLPFLVHNLIEDAATQTAFQLPNVKKKFDTLQAIDSELFNNYNLICQEINNTGVNLNLLPLTLQEGLRLLQPLNKKAQRFYWLPTKDRFKYAEGGMSDVYLVWDNTLKKISVLKVMKDNSRYDSATMVSEARAQAALSSRSVDGSTDDGFNFVNKVYEILDVAFDSPERVKQGVILEFLAPSTSMSLQEYISPVAPKSTQLELPFNSELVKSIIEQLCDSVDKLAGAHGLHCDLKPSNIYLRHISHGNNVTGLVKVILTDFGTNQRQIAEGKFGVSPEYAAPERSKPDWVAQAFTPDVRKSEQTKLLLQSEIYSLALIIAELLCKTPRNGKEFLRFLDDNLWLGLGKLFPGLDANNHNKMKRNVNDVLFYATHTAPESRYSSAGEFGQALLAALNVNG